MQRRTFVKLLSLPACLSLWPREAQAQAVDLLRDLTYTDSEATAPALLDTLKDDNPVTGIEYLP